MFFRNGEIALFIKFLWLGLTFGVIAIVLKNIARIFRKNVVIVNILSFSFWLLFGLVFYFASFRLNNLSFSGLGLCGMLAGVIIIKICVDFFFDYFIRFIYNEFIKRKRTKTHGKVQTDKKI